MMPWRGRDAGGGHPGTVMGAAAIGVALWRFAMRYNPKDPNWFNRDRFVLSAGQACLFPYIHLHLAGYDAWIADQLKTYHNPNPQLWYGSGTSRNRVLKAGLQPVELKR
ncbi:transketolase [Desarmillaria ectypa]|nr:transketolase [Desarmillaria ectypa]